MAGVNGIVAKNMRLGLNVSQYNRNVLSTSRVEGSYAYKVQFSDQSSLHFGLTAGVFQNRLDRDAIRSASENDPAWSSNLFDESLFYFGFGFRLRANRLNLSMASPLLYSSQEKRTFATFNAMASYDLPVEMLKLEVTPYVLARTSVDFPNFADFGARLAWDKRVWMQMGFRTNKDGLFGFGVRFGQFDLGYAFETTNSRLSAVTGGSHELMLLYSLE